MELSCIAVVIYGMLKSIMVSDSVQQFFTDPPDAARISVNRIGTEFVSNAVFIGAGICLEKGYDFAPVKEVVAEAIKPFLPALHDTADFFDALETEETQQRMEGNQHDQAYHFADVIVNTTIQGTLSKLSQMASQQHFDQLAGIHIPDSGTGMPWDNPYGRATMADTAVWLGSLVLFNSVLSKPNEMMQDSLQSVMQKAGMEEDTAHSTSRQLVALQLPNLAGALTAITSLCMANDALPAR